MSIWLTSTEDFNLKSRLYFLIFYINTASFFWSVYTWSHETVKNCIENLYLMSRDVGSAMRWRPKPNRYTLHITVLHKETWLFHFRLCGCSYDCKHSSHRHVSLGTLFSVHFYQVCCNSQIYRYCQNLLVWTCQKTNTTAYKTLKSLSISLWACTYCLCHL